MNYAQSTHPSVQENLFALVLTLFIAPIVATLLNVPLLLLHPTLGPAILTPPYSEVIFLGESAMLACGIFLGLHKRSALPVYAGLILAVLLLMAGQLLLPDVSQIGGV
jgi:hypothetical protein